MSGRELTDEELQKVIAHVAQAGFDPDARERARGRLTGFRWKGKILQSSDKLPPSERHYIAHVGIDKEWPEGTSLNDYLHSIRGIILDPLSGVFVNRYQGTLSFGVARQSKEVKGPRGHDWVLIQYRVKTGHWTTAFQPELGIDEELAQPEWSDVKWLRQPKRENMPSST